MAGCSGLAPMFFFLCSLLADLKSKGNQGVTTPPQPPLCSKNYQWRRVGGDLASISVGPAGVWGIRNSQGEVYHQTQTYGKPGATGSKWRHVPGLLRRLDVGDDVVWGITPDGYLACRKGITRPGNSFEDSMNPSKHSGTGTSWLKLRTKAIDVAISPKGFLVAIAENGTLFYREGLSSACEAVSEWVSDGDTSLSLRQVSAGKSGVWAVDDKDVLHVRNQTYGDNGTFGTGWIKVDENMMQVSAGESTVIAVDKQGRMWRRERMSEASPEGLPRVQVLGRAADVEVYDGCYAWAVTSQGNIYFTHIRD